MECLENCFCRLDVSVVRDGIIKRAQCAMYVEKQKEKPKCKLEQYVSRASLLYGRGERAKCKVMFTYIFLNV